MLKAASQEKLGVQVWLMIFCSWLWHGYVDPLWGVMEFLVGTTALWYGSNIDADNITYNL